MAQISLNDDNSRMQRLMVADRALLRALGYFRDRVPIIAGALLLLVLSTLASLVFPLVTRHTIDVVIPSLNVTMLWVMAGVMLFAPVLSSCLAQIQGFIMTRVGVEGANRLRSEMLHNLMHWPLLKWDKAKTGEVNSRIVMDSSTIQGLVTDVLPGLLRHLLTLPSALVMLFILDPKLTLVCLTFVPLYVVPVLVFGPLTRAAWRDVADRRGDMMRDVQESLLGVRVLKALVRESYQLSRLTAPLREYMRSHLRADALGRWFNLALSTAGGLVPAGLLGYGGMLVMRGDTTIGTLVAFITYLQQMYGSLSALPALWVQSRRYTSQLERVFEYLDEDMEEYDGKVLPVISGRDKAVRFDNVLFGYDPNDPVLKGVSFELEDGRVAALVGPSGCGKTTVAALIAGLYRPTGGEIHVGPYRLSDIDLRELRRYVGLVAQDTFLFNATIIDNIRYGRPDATEQEIREAAVIARVDQFASSFREGYDSIVGERGVQLSGGQRQRIAIARTILQNPPILLLDEATSSLDPTTEAEVQEALMELMRGRTCLIITHRLATVMNASNIMVMQDGQIVDQGSHEQLTRLSRLYQEMLSRQGKGVARADLDV